ncbi:MAG TPA: NAD-dependent epimerase/dehydratase family protein, partial [Kofleriaceae bacterium]|nr:NAD-dependent epimerase/dehydratase family protein [Kofleriaceae bacterium]
RLMNSSSPRESQPLHVVLGAGQIGPLVARRLLDRGLRVRMVRRGRFGAELPAGVEGVSADLTDPAARTAAVRDAAVVYHCMNPIYTTWAKELLPMTRAVLDAAAGAGAHLVVLDNLYMYGRAPGGVMREETPMTPCSRKGELRARASDELTGARARGVVVTIGRASDFIGPGATMAAVFGDRFWPRAFAGKAGEVCGDPDQPHSYSYVGDVADGLVTLGTDARAANGLWHLPVNAATSSRELIADVGRALGRPLAATRLAPWLLRALGVFSPMLREVAEMAYQWQAPFILDDSRYRATFGGGPTPWSEALPATVAWARSHYAAAAASSPASAAA